MESVTKWLLRFSFFLCLLAVPAAKAAAMDFQIHPNSNSKTLTAILATGEIKEGDTQALRVFLRGLPAKPNAAVYLSSLGGDLYEGLKLGLFLRESRIKSVIEGGRPCFSACALAFLGGTDNNGKPWRSSSTNSQIGFHAFRPSSANAPTTDEIQKVVSEILSYGKAVEAPIELLIYGFATPSDDIFIVPNSDLCSFGIKLWSVETKKFVCSN